MLFDDDGFVTPRLYPPDPHFALAQLWAYGIEKQQRQQASRRAQPVLLESPTQHDVWDRLTAAGRLVIDRLFHGATHAGRRTPPMVGGPATA